MSRKLTTYRRPSIAVALAEEAVQAKTPEEIYALLAVLDAPFLAAASPKTQRRWRKILTEQLQRIELASQPAEMAS